MRSDKDTERGIYDKYVVTRTDGSSDVGGKHQWCRYFVLDLTHDQYAEAALRAYAKACRGEFPYLAGDLVALADEISNRPDAARQERPAQGGRDKELDRLRDVVKYAAEQVMGDSADHYRGCQACADALKGGV